MKRYKNTHDNIQKGRLFTTLTPGPCHTYTLHTLTLTVLASLHPFAPVVSSDAPATPLNQAHQHSHTASQLRTQLLKMQNSLMDGTTISLSPGD